MLVSRLVIVCYELIKQGIKALLNSGSILAYRRRATLRRKIGFWKGDLIGSGHEFHAYEDSHTIVYLIGLLVSICYSWKSDSTVLEAISWRFRRMIVQTHWRISCQ